MVTPSSSPSGEPAAPGQRRPTLRETQRAVTRDRIVEALEQLIGDEHPFEVSMSAVATRAGVSEPTLYRHFPTKRDLFAALATRQYRAMVEGVAPRSREALIDAVATVFGRTLDNEQAIRWTLAAPDRERVPRPNVHARTAMLQEAAADGLAALPPDEQEHLIRLLLLLSSPMAMLYWNDYLGLTADDAARSAAWAITRLWPHRVRVTQLPLRDGK